MRSRMKTQSSVAEIVDHFDSVLQDQGLFEALGYLNSTTDHRFTGIYRFEPDWVRSVLLFDRGNPHLRAGEDVRMKESYCMLTQRTGGPYIIENAQTDPRLLRHAARDSVLCYCAVHLLGPEGLSWGTLCHFDFRPREITAESLEVLEAVRPAVQRAVWVLQGSGQEPKLTAPSLSR
jgi:GAF domain-containing protein